MFLLDPFGSTVERPTGNHSCQAVSCTCLYWPCANKAAERCDRSYRDGLWASCHWGRDQSQHSNGDKQEDDANLHPEQNAWYAFCPFIWVSEMKALLNSVELHSCHIVMIFPELFVQTDCTSHHCGRCLNPHRLSGEPHLQWRCRPLRG